MFTFFLGMCAGGAIVYVARNQIETAYLKLRAWLATFKSKS